jgi:ABC-type branched-subunit amino acid transport system ATPase component
MPLTVLENLKVGRCDVELALTLFPELAPRKHQKAGTLSGGEQQMLTLARALASRPRCLLADEISLGLSPLLVNRLLTAVRNAADAGGLGVVLVEQQVRRAVAIADRVYVMRQGEIVLSGSARTLETQIETIQAAYMGGSDG